MDSLLEIIDKKLLPWARDQDKQRLIVFGSALRKANLPKGVRISKRLPCGPRTVIRGNRTLTHPNRLTAKWPHDGLVETAGVPLLICAYGGRTDYWAGDSVVHCGEGHFLLVPPGLRHDGGVTPHYDFDIDTPSDDDFCDFLWIGRWGRVIRIWTCHSAGAVHGSRQATQADFLNDAVNTVFDLLVAEAMIGQPFWQTLCREYLLVLLTLLHRDLASGAILLSSRTIPEIDATGEGDLIAQAPSYIKNHLRESLTIDKMAQKCCISRTRFTQLFRQVNGQSFGQYVTQCRIEEARQLLTDTDWSVRRVCSAVGLNSESYFCRLFAAHAGMSPQTFRHSQTNASQVRDIVRSDNASADFINPNLDIKR